jgi:hypothetical protein
VRTRLLWGAALSLAAVMAAACVGIAGADSNGSSSPPSEFVIGNGPNNSNAMPSTTNEVTFWGAQWWKNNPLQVSGAPTDVLAPASFKGYSTSFDVTGACGSFTSSTGNSSDPPATLPLNADGTISVLVADKVVQKGSTITGEVVGTATILPDPGYAGDPGHPGTGTVQSFSPCVGPSL